jgi:hypothetical protein
MSSSQFFVTRKGADGRRYEVPIADLPDPNRQREATSKPAAAARFGQSLPNLLNEVDQHIRKLESTLPAEGSSQRGAADKALVRWRRRRGILAECRFPFGPSDGLDTYWGFISDKLIPDATAAGLAVDDSYQPTGRATVQAAPTAALVEAIRGLAPRVRQLEYIARMQAAGRDQYSAGALLERADALAYAAAHLDTGNIPTNNYIDQIIDLTSIMLPLHSRAMAEGRLITVDHNENLSWARQQHGRK